MSSDSWRRLTFVQSPISISLSGFWRLVPFSQIQSNTGTDCREAGREYSKGAGGSRANSEDLTPENQRVGHLCSEEVVRGCGWGYAQDLMRLRLLVPVLVLLLSGADSGAAVICAASCASSSRGSAPSQRHNYSEHNVRGHGKMCAECPAKSENGVNSASDCSGVAGVQGLTESGFSLVASRQIDQALIASASRSPVLVCYRPQFALFGTSPTIKSRSASSIPLRI